MITCSNEEMQKYIIDCGFEYTGDIFILLTNVWIRVGCQEMEVTSHPGDVVVYKTRYFDKYLCWNYKTNVRREVNADTFRLQFKVFNVIKETHSDYHDNILQEILDNDLMQFAYHSEHLL